MSEDNREYWLAIDQGTTSTRAVLYDSVGQTVATAKRNVTLHRRKQLGHIEQNATEIAASVDDAVSEVVGPIDNPKQIRGAALATQRSSVVAWDRVTGEPLSPVLSWQDTRCRDVIRELDSEAVEIQRRTGLPLSAHYGASKISWLLHAEHDDRATIDNARLHKRLVVGPLASIVAQQLLEVRDAARVDHANAGRTQLMDVTTGEWDPWLLNMFNVPLDVLPEIQPTESDFGTLRLAPARLLVVQGDQTAAVFGEGGLANDLAHVNLGTGGFVLSATSHIKSDARLLRSVASSRHSEGNATTLDYVLEGTINGCGAAVDWAAKRFGVTVNEENIERWLAAKQPPIFINTIGGLGSPYWCAGPAPHWINANGEGEAKQFPVDVAMCAVFESIAFLVVANLRAMQSSRKTGDVIRRLRVTGGLSRSNEFCQRLADVAQLAVQRPTAIEATARGAAWLAAGRPASWHRADPSTDQWTPQENPEGMRRCDNSLKRIETIPTQRAPTL